ncbi:rhodanese-like domain-containing protein [Oceanirhabdus seepicola]|uniref:Rhodanese-like domain-containing protein n=1 Tax=Oceanirhabdus seepicola TaxID=2828781 RepID=A0A9J6P3X7_9CLOT|nr:rhodanese-like domain-containing protein [Oceanirhabdus seepicola]MCM1991243.1 rhodanese-like domain-containing protein [Oceanirhabdus seepicola]
MKRIVVLAILVIFLTMVVGCNSQKKALNNSSNASTENNKKSNENINNQLKEDSEMEQESKETIAIYKDVSTVEAKELIQNTEDLVILDVRTEEEYNEGHLKNAINISHELVEKRLSEIEQYKNIPILIYCRTGRRSGIVLDILKKNNFNIVYHMHEGISQWTYEVEK